MNTQNPYMQMTDLGGQNPMMQNTAAQQQMYQQNMSNMGMLANQANDTKGTSRVQFDPKAMAGALRAGQTPQQPQGNDWFTRGDMAMNSQASPELMNQVNQMGSTTWNPFSDYNMGTNGWGNYGE